MMLHPWSAIYQKANCFQVKLPSSGTANVAYPLKKKKVKKPCSKNFFFFGFSRGRAKSLHFSPSLSSPLQLRPSQPPRARPLPDLCGCCGCCGCCGYCGYCGCSSRSSSVVSRSRHRTDVHSEFAHSWSSKLQVEEKKHCSSSPERFGKLQVQETKAWTRGKNCCLHFTLCVQKRTSPCKFAPPKASLDGHPNEWMCGWNECNFLLAVSACESPGNFFFPALASFFKFLAPDARSRARVRTQEEASLLLPIVAEKNCLYLVRACADWRVPIFFYLSLTSFFTSAQGVRT